jgi:hypothetical protein
MSKKLYLILVLSLAAVFIFSACNRSASSAPIATPTKGVQGPQNVGGGATEDPMAMVKLFATQTAMAAGGQPSVATPISGTPVPGTTPGASATATSLIPPTGGPTTPVVVTPVPTTVRPASYTLQAGEHPFCIARRFNIDPVELLTLNGLTDGQLFQPGMVLKIPQAGNMFPGPRALKTHPTTYIILVNDTIYKIGCYFGDVDPLAIAAVNHLVSPYTLNVGQSLSIP